MDLICMCHLRWNFVYQRPQHLMNRFAINNRVFIVEEPVYNAASDFYEISKPAGEANLWRIVLHVSKQLSAEKTNGILKALIDSMMCSNHIEKYALWYYSPMALDYTDHLSPQLIIYDCMDELSAFKGAPSRLQEMELKLLSKADVVFTGGQSLYKAKKHLHDNIHAFPSSIDKSHFVIARSKIKDPDDQAPIGHPRFGFYGVIDERFDSELVQQMAILRPGWNFVFIGPTAKIDPAKLPKSENIFYLGMKSYQDLPSYLSGWDVAILPFALNESTKYISPTKTPEYLSAGKPVISTSITDVVNPYGDRGLVQIADTAEAFIAAGEKILADKNTEEWQTKVDAFLSDISWNKTWRKMATLMDEAFQKKNEIISKSTVYV